MMLTVAGAMSTAELGISMAEMIRAGNIHAICCTGANLEEDVFNLVAHSHYERVPNYRDLTPADEQALLDRHLNRVTDTCIPEEEAMRRIERIVLKEWMAADQSGSNNKDFDSYGGGLNSTVAPLANTWNPAYQAINTLNAALERGPNTQGIAPSVKKTLLAEAHFLRALNYFTLSNVAATDFTPLVDNLGLGTGDTVQIYGTLDCAGQAANIKALKDRGAYVYTSCP